MILDFCWPVSGVDLRVYLGWLTMRAGHDHHVYAAVRGGSLHKARFAPAGSGVFWDLFLGVPHVELIGLCSKLVLIPPLGVLFLGPLGKNFGAWQCQMLPVAGLGLPVC